MGPWVGKEQCLRAFETKIHFEVIEELCDSCLDLLEWFGYNRRGMTCGEKKLANTPLIISDSRTPLYCPIIDDPLSLAYKLVQLYCAIEVDETHRPGKIPRH